jgi:hypothetical protein
MLKTPIAAALILLIAPAQAAECFLSHDDCVIIARELLMLDIQSRRDEAALSFMPAYPRGLKVIELEGVNARARFAVLPIRIGNEMARMMLCDSERRHNLMREIPGDPASCRRGWKGSR